MNYDHLTDAELVREADGAPSPLVRALRERLEVRLEDSMISDVRTLLAISQEEITLDDMPELHGLNSPVAVAGYLLGIITYGLTQGYDLTRAWEELMAAAALGAASEQGELL